MDRFALPAGLAPGDPFPWVSVASTGKPQFACLASRFSLLCFSGTFGDALGAGVLGKLRERRREFEQRGVQPYLVSVDAGDRARLSGEAGLIPLFDDDAKLSRLCGRIEEAGEDRRFRRGWILVDPTLHVLATFDFPIAGDGFAEVLSALESLSAPQNFAGCEMPAPVLMLPNVLEPELCAALIDYFETVGGKASGVYSGGTNAMDNSFKSRSDVQISDAGLRAVLRERFLRRVAPEIRKLFFIELTRLERYLLGCYAAEDGGFFGPHRDIGTKHTAHRRFAMSINLNADFEGGGVIFPEYNLRPHKPPPGWAVAFPAAILHTVQRVTRGRRYAYLDFLYDEAGEALRKEAGRIA